MNNTKLAALLYATNSMTKEQMEKMDQIKENDPDLRHCLRQLDPDAGELPAPLARMVNRIVADLQGEPALFAARPRRWSSLIWVVAASILVGGGIAICLMWALTDSRSGRLRDAVATRGELFYAQVSLKDAIKRGGTPNEQTIFRTADVFVVPTGDFTLKFVSPRNGNSMLIVFTEGNEPKFMPKEQGAKVVAGEENSVNVEGIKGGAIILVVVVPDSSAIDRLRAAIPENGDRLDSADSIVEQLTEMTLRRSEWAVMDRIAVKVEPKK